MTEEIMRAELAAGLMAAHRLAARALSSAYRPALEDFEQLAAAAVDSLNPLRVLAINRALRPLITLEAFLTRLETRFAH